MGYIFGLVLGFVIFIMPLILFVLNIICLFKKEGKIFNKRRRYAGQSLAFGFILFALAIYCMSSYKWDESVVSGAANITTHQPFSEDYIIWLAVIAIIAVISLIILDNDKILPPLAASLYVSGVYAGILLFFICSVQLFSVFLPHDNSGVFSIDPFSIIFYLYLYILNYFVCSVRIIGDTIRKYCDHFMISDTDSRWKFSRKLAMLLSRASGWIVFPALCLIPLTGLLITVCIIGGQGADGIIKAFTETSDWTFSRMVSPPPIQYEGHYLCTVAVNGHEKVVKPTRMGVRHSVKIVVNRQLCTANAFEQLIEDKTPRFHKLVRNIYDTYGYPISKYITTKPRADIVYFIMKPLEWIFLITLYLFDENPESRIALQYTGRHICEFKGTENT
ncbi:MAG: hypothetical protein Q4F95_15500 [Oscillospiraceae bacterium]|nr:hypothetical protein [Oscillospiraceae bacterium]